MQQQESPSRKWTSVIAERESSSVQMSREGEKTNEKLSIPPRKREAEKHQAGYDGWTWFFEFYLFLFFRLRCKNEARSTTFRWGLVSRY